MITKKLSPFDNKVWLSSPTKHAGVLKYVSEAYETNWMSTVGKNIDEIERSVAIILRCKYAVALLYGMPRKVDEIRAGGLHEEHGKRGSYGWRNRSNLSYNRKSC